MTQGTVSVVIPVHNGEAFVCDAIASALAQQDVPVEVIVVDNGSVDRTRELVAAVHGHSVRLLTELTPGAAAARNRGASAASGEYLAFLDADDVWLPRKLRAQVDVLLGGADIVFSHCLEFHHELLTPEQRREFSCRPEPYPFLAPSSFLSTRDTFARVGDFPNFPAGEFIAWYGLAQSLGLRSTVLPGVLVRRGVHATNTTRDRRSLAGFPLAAKWLLDRRRQLAENPRS